jgi:hypothetical protein
MATLQERGATLTGLEVGFGLRVSSIRSAAVVVARSSATGSRIRHTSRGQAGNHELAELVREVSRETGHESR